MEFRIDNQFGILDLVVQITLSFLEIQYKLCNCIPRTKGKRKAGKRELSIVCAIHDSHYRAKYRYGKTDCRNQMQMLLFQKQNFCFFCCGLNRWNITIAFIVIIQQIICCNMEQFTNLQYVLCIGQCGSIFPSADCLPRYIQLFCKIFLRPSICLSMLNDFLW